MSARVVLDAHDCLGFAAGLRHSIHTFAELTKCGVLLGEKA
ncbi:MAG: hypothetical protein VW362_10900 [Candidatus Nanopelagicales bacterium]